MADQPSNPAATLALVVKLADPAFQELRKTNPAQALEELKTLLTSLNAQVPDNLEELLADAPGAQRYQDLLAELTKYENPLTSPKDVDIVLKLAPPPVFGIHCPHTDKLA